MKVIFLVLAFLTVPLFGEVKNKPIQPFRCFMVDMGRNPHSPETLRQVVDMMKVCKANYLQLHLSDDQLFSWPSKIYPKLYSKNAGWTWEDFVALESYSQERGVTIIPEIDVPGHSTILRREYPEIFGKTTTDLATKKEAQAGVEKLIAEVLSVFQATPYYHMGGDEAYGVPETAQRAFINRINHYVKSLDKRLIVWEGPHQGKGKDAVDHDVIHMCWRSVEFPAQKMLDARHEVVNASWDPLYIVDHYPRTMFTAVDLERCFNFEIRRFAHINHEIPSFSKPQKIRASKRLMGFCMPWWEGREENLIPMCFPRLAAVTSQAASFAEFQKEYPKLLAEFEKESGYKMPKLPLAKEDTQQDNLAYQAKVTVSAGASQPHFSPARLTNGITDRFDHFLGFPTTPKPLEISVHLEKLSKVSQIVVHERAIQGSYEVYQVMVSADGETFKKVGSSEKGTRGENSFVEHSFEEREVKVVKIVTEGCHGLTFPSFSRLSEIIVK